MNCPFCDNEKVQSRLIYKDDLVMVFPTNIPITPGHVLVAPARHLAKIDELSDTELVALRKVIIQMKSALQKTFQAEGFNIAWNEGKSAGQSVDHFHIHIVPRKTGDAGIYEYEPRKFLYRPGSREESPDKELEEVTKLIKQGLE